MSIDRAGEKTKSVFARQPRGLTPDEIARVSGGRPNLVTGPKDGGGTDNESRTNRIG